MYLNFHTHHISEHKEDFDIIELYNIDLEKGPREFSKGDFQCLGLHPWILRQEFLTKLGTFEEYFLEADVLCIGEIGLDRVCDVDFALQLKLFNFQLDLAHRRGDSFIVIHCVKAYEEIIKCVDRSDYDGRLVFHDYNGGHEVTAKLLELGCYFSYGKMLFRNNSKGFLSLKDIPLDRIFLETDDQNKFVIEDAYSALAQIKNTSIKSLEDQIISNFEKIKEKG